MIAAVATSFPSVVEGTASPKNTIHKLYEIQILSNLNPTFIYYIVTFKKIYKQAYYC